MRFLDKLLRKLRHNRVAKFAKPNSNALDLGCGLDFAFLKSIAGKVKSGYGIDKKAENADLGVLHIRNINLDEDDLPDEWRGFFDQAFALAVIEHLANPERALVKIYKTMKPGGEIYITTPSKMARPVLNWLSALGLIDSEEIKDHKHYFLKQELTDLLRKAGFSEIKHRFFELGFNQFLSAKK